MIPVSRPAEPADFDARCRAPGNRWLAAHPPQPGEKLPNHWRQFIPALCRGFQNRCGYLAMFDLDGTVDHFLSTDSHRHLAYEWSNYRYATGWLNSSKQNVNQRILDPFEVREEWFEIDLDSLHLKLTGAVPARIRPRAVYTLERLRLDYGPRVMQKREFYYGEFQRGAFPLGWLEQVAPLIATAVRRGRLLAHLTANPLVSRQEVAVICEVTPQRAAMVVRNWRAAGHIVAVGRGTAVRYQRV